MRLYRVWICRKDGAYILSRFRPKCPVCGEQMFKAPASMSIFVFGAVENKDGATKNTFVPPVYKSELYGAPQGIVHSKQFAADNVPPMMIETEPIEKPEEVEKVEENQQQKAPRRGRGRPKKVKSATV